jgi:hypothetical protein
VAHIPDFPQFLVRALIIRSVIGCSEKASQRNPTAMTRLAVVEIACRLATK